MPGASTAMRSPARSGRFTPRLDAFEAEWGHRYPAAVRLWRNAWQECIPFLDYDTEIRKVICSTNAIVAVSTRSGTTMTA